MTELKLNTTREDRDLIFRDSKGACALSQDCNALEDECTRLRKALDRSDDPVQALIDLTQTFQGCGLDAPTAFTMTRRTVDLLRPILARADRLAESEGAAMEARICEGGCVVAIYFQETK